MLRWLALLLAVCSTVGCSGSSRTVTISTVPPDATLRVDGSPRGRGPITETFDFSGDTVSHTVTAQRLGYSDQDVTILRDSPGDYRVIRLKPVSRNVTIRVRPVPAVVTLDGRKLAAGPVSEVTTDLEFPLDPSGRWTTRRISATHPKFRPIEVVATFDDGRRDYELDLETLRKDLVVTTVPEGADVFINDETLGRSTMRHAGFAFPVDPATGDFVPQELRIVKRGYTTVVKQIGWDDGKENYSFELEPQSKVVRIVTDPPDARVELDGVEVPLDGDGRAHSAPFVFAPINDEGDAPVLQGTVSKQEGDREWESQPIAIGWDDGRTDYEVKLKEILTRAVPMTRLRTRWGAKGWTVSAESSQPVAMRDAGEPAGRPKPQRVTKLPPGTVLDTLALAPDGSQLLYTTLKAGEGAAPLRSQMFLQRTEGEPDPKPLSDGRTLDVMPAFTPDGVLVVFASNRAGRALSIWSVSVAGGGGPEQLTAGDSNDLWPSVDSNPKPRLFYQSLIHTRGEPRLFSVPLGAVTPRRDLSPPTGGGAQPRVGPKADAIVFAAPNGPKRKGDLFRASDTGAGFVNLTNTPDVDEFDPTWSDDGRRVAYASDRGRTAEAPDNYDLYVLDLAPGGTAAEPHRVTYNGSWDDCPVWDVGSGALYFRSNRGGQWNVWRIEVK